MKVVDQARSLPRATKVLLATNAVNSFGGGLVLPFLWIYLGDVRHLAAWVPAATLAVQAVTAIGGGLVWGVVLDRLAYKAVVPLVMVVAGLGTGLYGVAVNPALALLAAVVYGLGISGVGTSLRVMYAATNTPEQRGVAYALDFGVFNAMTGLGVLVGGWVAVAGIGTAADRYALLFLGDAITFIFTGVVTGILLPARTEPRGAREGRERTGYRDILGNSQLLILYVTLLLALLVSYGQFKSGLPAYLTDRGAVGAGGLSFTFALNIGVAVAAQFLMMPRLDGVSRIRLIALSGVMFAGCWICVLLAGAAHGTAALWLAGIGVSLLSVGEVMVVPVVTTLVNNVVSDGLRGHANALLSITTSTSSVLGPLLAGVLLLWRDGIGLMVFLIGASLLTMVMALLMRRQDRTSEAGSAPTADASPTVEATA